MHRRLSERRWPHRALIAANLVVFLLIAATASGYGYVQWRLGQVHRVKVHGLISIGKGRQSVPVPGVSAGPPFTLLVVGSDTRNLAGADNSQFGDPVDTGGQRSDSIILARVVPATSSIALLSVPRDLLVAIPGMGTTRINSAFETGTPDLLIRTIQQDFGIEVNHYVALNFDSFRQIADAIGGVEQYFPTRARDRFTNLSIPAAGCYNLVGDQALAFVRSREYEYYLDGEWHFQLYPESDLGRIQRQQEFIKKAVKKAESSGLTNPVALNGLIAGITKNLTVDSGFSVNEMITLAEQFRHVNPEAIQNWTYPTVNSTEVSGALAPLKSDAAAVVQQFLAAGQVVGPTPSSTSTTSGGASTATTATIVPSSISVQVFNGSGASGQAESAANTLERKGFRVISTGDASAFNHATSVIEYGPASGSDAAGLQAMLVGGATLQEDSALPASQLVLITGRTYDGLTGALGGSIPTTTGSTTSTTVASSTTSTSTAIVNPASSSTYDGQYIPPGLKPGQVPLSCGT